MPYRVLIVVDHPRVKNQWWSDQKPLATFALAQAHRKAVARQWNDCDTAITAPDGRVLAYRESLKAQQDLAALLKD